MIKTIQDLIAKPAPWLYFLLVVALLIIVTNNSGLRSDLEADLSNANDEISASETLIEALSDEVAVRNDAVASVKAERDALEGTVATLTGQLEDALANPSCPVAEPCPEAEACPEVVTTETTATQ